MVPTPTVSFFRATLCALVLPSTATLAHAVDRRVPSQYPTIQAAVNAAASSGDRVLIANGTYTGVGNRDIDLGTKNLVVQSESDNALNCVIDCQYLGRGIRIHGNQTSATVVRGLTITRGTAQFGGGILNYPTAAIIENCRFISNVATQDGGGVDNTRGTMRNCTFIGNASNNAGGGLNMEGGGTAINCTFRENISNFGGGLCVFRGSSSPGASATNCVFIANSSRTSSSGYIGPGAIYVGDENFAAINCTFIRNTGKVGAIYNYLRGTQINCSFYGNKGNSTYGAVGGVYNDNGGKQINCIIYGNSTTGPSLGNEVFNLGSNTGQTNCLVGGLPFNRDANGNFGADPLFFNAAGDDLHISPGSPAINAGVNVTNPDIPTDLDGYPRITGSVRDIGAYELHSGIVGYSLSGVSVNRYQVGVGLVNTDRFTETNVRITSATLGGYPTATALPLNTGTILASGSKTVVLSFPYAYPYGSYQLLVVSGTTSIGPFTSYIPVYVY